MAPPRYRRNPQTAGRVIDGLAFVVTPDDNRLHTLNTTATYLWEVAMDACTDEALADALADRYEVDRDTALRDVRACLADLVSRQILIVA